MGAHDHPERVPEESVKPILARAAELDRRQRETVDVDVLRSAALEAGISADAVDRAVEEYAAGVGVTKPPPQQAADPRFDRFLRRRKLAAIAAGAMAASGLAVAANAHVPGVAFGVVAAGVVAALLGVVVRSRNSSSR